MFLFEKGAVARAASGDVNENVNTWDWREIQKSFRKITCTAGSRSGKWEALAF
jgi:hypothetical protein